MLSIWTLSLSSVFLPNSNRFPYLTFATGVASQQRILTPPYALSSPLGTCMCSCFDTSLLKICHVLELWISNILWYFYFTCKKWVCSRVSEYMFLLFHRDLPLVVCMRKCDMNKVKHNLATDPKRARHGMQNVHYDATSIVMQSYSELTMRCDWHPDLKICLLPMWLLYHDSGPQSLCNRRFGGIFVLSRCFLDFSVGIGFFCHRTESDLLLILLSYWLYY